MHQRHEPLLGGGQEGVVHFIAAKGGGERVEIGLGSGALARAGDISQGVNPCTDEQGDDAENEHDLDECETARGAEVAEVRVFHGVR